MINGGEIVSTLASSTTNYLSEFSPIFLLIAGIVFAMGIMDWLISTISNNRTIDNENTKE